MLKTRKLLTSLDPTSQAEPKNSTNSASKLKHIYGAHDADRTRDLSLTKGVLYH